MNNMINRTRAYMGNPNLRKSNYPIEWTPEKIQEFFKCSQDPIYFIENYMKIVVEDEDDEGNNVVPFKLRKYQKKAILGIHNNRKSAFNFARQSGKSIMIAGYLMWFIIFNENKTVAVLSNKGANSLRVLADIKKSYELLPDWLQHGIIEWNKGTAHLENGSMIIATGTTKDNVRGYRISIAYLDEAAFIENYEEFFTSVYPTISSGKNTKIIMTSTPNGMNHFYKTIQGAKKKDPKENNGYFIMEVPWHQVPGRGEKWRIETLKGLNNDQQKFDSEFNIQFLGSTNTLIAGWKLAQLESHDPIKETSNAFPGLKQYCTPLKSQSYIIIVDTSEGKGLDYSAFQIIDCTKMPYVQVATYRNNTIVPSDYAQLIFQIAKGYNNCPILIEVNSMGNEVANILHDDLEYDNIIFTENEKRGGKKITMGFGNHTANRVDKGIFTSASVKATGCGALKIMIEDNKLIINDFGTIEELSTFSKKGKSWQAEEGKHDDLVSPLFLFGWITTQTHFKDLININTLLKIREKSDEEIFDELVNFALSSTEEPQEIKEKLSPNWLFDESNETQTDYEVEGLY